jgi:hypothetical protein
MTLRPDRRSSTTKKVSDASAVIGEAGLGHDDAGHARHVVGARCAPKPVLWSAWVDRDVLE